MDKLKIIGNGPLQGEISISGAKNAALPIMCASLLSSDPLILKNVPALKDVETTMAVLRDMGVVVVKDKTTDELTLQAAQIDNLKVVHDLVKTMRASILILGPTLARWNECTISLPGGCSIGSRPVDQHIRGLQAMGAEISIEHGDIKAKGTRLKGAHIKMAAVTVTGTENLLMAATLAEGITVLENAAQEPEVIDLAHCLIKMGAKIQGVGTSVLTIEGVESLHGAHHTILADRIETGTFLCAVAMTGGKVLLTNAAPSTLTSVLLYLQQAGLDLKTGSDWILAQMQQRPKAVSFTTAPYPAFPTDMQAQFMAMDAIAEGDSEIIETIFENRFMHVPELNRMGADISIGHHNNAHIHGVEKLSGTTVMATDLRASASLVLAGLVAEGETTVERVYHLDRGYARIEEKLSGVGAKISRIRG